MDAPPSTLEDARLRIAHLRLGDAADLLQTMTRAAAVSAETLAVARVGVWFLSPGLARLTRSVAWESEAPAAGAAAELTLELDATPSYRDAIESRRVVVADDAVLDPQTRELAASYLEVQGITSLLDAPIFLGGELCGVLCHEHVGTARRWSPREIDFAISVADMLSAMLESARRLEAEVELRAREAADAKRRLEQAEEARERLESERDSLRLDVFPIKGFDGLVGRSPGLVVTLELLRAVTPTDATVLLLGESGVGKELFAAAIHEASERARGPFVRINCAAVPRELFESEFFGHVRGAFTGAIRDRRGRFELADGGTLFLDEVADIPADAQASLLRVLQESTYSRVGDEAVRTANVRVIAATNKDLEEEVEAGRFRADLYYRIAVFPIPVPPLRERREDIAPLAEHFLAQSSAKLRRAGLSFSEADLERLSSYDWPGNVRELQNVIERAVILSPAPPLRLDLAWPRPRGRRHTAAPRTKKELDAAEREALVVALRECGGRIGGPGGAAARVGIAASTFRDRMRAHQLDAK